MLISQGFSLLATLLGLHLILFIHEIGHQWASPTQGHLILGTGPTLGSWTIRGSKITLRLFPYLGQLYTQGETSCLRKLWIILAGPLANILLGWALLAIAAHLGIAQWSPTVASVEGSSQFSSETPYIITQVENTPILNHSHLVMALLPHYGYKHSLSIKTKEHDFTLQTEDWHWDTKVNFWDSLGVTMARPLYSNRVERVYPFSAAQNAGLTPHDQIIRVNDKEVQDWKTLKPFANPPDKSPQQVTFLRKGQVHTTTLYPQWVIHRGLQYTWGFKPQLGKDSPTQKTTNPLPWPQAFTHAFTLSGTWLLFQIKVLHLIASLHLSPFHLAGPVEILILGIHFSITLVQWCYFFAYLSLSLAVINLLPIPGLDGFSFLQTCVYQLTNKRMDPALERLLAQLFLIALLVFLVHLTIFKLSI